MGLGRGMSLYGANGYTVIRMVIVNTIAKLHRELAFRRDIMCISCDWSALMYFSFLIACLEAHPQLERVGVGFAALNDGRLYAGLLQYVRAAEVLTELAFLWVGTHRGGASSRTHKLLLPMACIQRGVLFTPP